MLVIVRSLCVLLLRGHSRAFRDAMGPVWHFALAARVRNAAVAGFIVVGPIASVRTRSPAQCRLMAPTKPLASGPPGAHRACPSSFFSDPSQPWQRRRRFFCVCAHFALPQASSHFGHPMPWLGPIVGLSRPPCLGRTLARR